MNQDKSLTRLKNVMSNAYAPYSNYYVSAIIVTESGNSYVGCNVENASYPEGQCAEANAIGAMIAAGEKKIKQIYIMSQDREGASPCGGCRQRIREFSDGKTLINLCSPEKIVKTCHISDLLPYSFGPEHLS